MQIKLIVLLCVWISATASTVNAADNEARKHETNLALTKVSTGLQSKANKGWGKSQKWFDRRNSCFPPFSTFCNAMGNRHGKQAAKKTNQSMTIKKATNDFLKQSQPSSSQG